MNRRAAIQRSTYNEFFRIDTLSRALTTRRRYLKPAPSLSLDDPPVINKGPEVIAPDTSIRPLRRVYHGPHSILREEDLQKSALWRLN